ncbi:MAG: hypothetical protein QOE41_543 [Mycobacterium sp.]|jgi:hypothetical protein|nr:hypothetical protein [Mycobacterium sp.]
MRLAAVMSSEATIDDSMMARLDSVLGFDHGLI